MDEKLKQIYEELCQLALRISGEKNTTGKGLGELPAILDRIIQINRMLR